MATITLQGVKSGAYDFNEPTTNFHSSQTVQYGSGEYLCVMFEEFPDAYKYKKITSFTLEFYVAGVTSIMGASSKWVKMTSLSKLIDPETITWGNADDLHTPVTGPYVSKTNVPGYASKSETLNERTAETAIKRYLQYGAMADADVYFILATTRHAQKPRLVVEYDEDDVTLAFKDYTTGNWGAGKENVIKWYAGPSTRATYLPVKQKTAKVQWKSKDGSTINEIDIDAGESDENNYCEITVPAGVLPAGDIMWRVRATATNGKESVSDWYERKVWDVAIRSASPSSGYVPKAKASTFTWSLAQPYGNGGYQYTPLTQKTATFRWRTGDGATVHEIACGTNTSVTIPAGTFTTDAIQWQVTAATEEGVSATSEWMELSTVEVTSKAEALSPKGEVVDGRGEAVFQWAHIISTGTEQTKAELQIAADGQTWTALATVTGAERTYTAPASTLGSGTKYWRVRTYNTDNVAGAWSDAAEFICVDAPDAPAVAVERQTPRPVIRWKSEGQLAYQVQIDGIYNSGTYYGTEKTWTAPLYLDDGGYTVRVRVQNEYGLWSKWGAAAMQIVNVTDTGIILWATNGAAVALRWTPYGDYDAYIVYRDGVAIAKTTSAHYTDLTAVGDVEYKVRGIIGTTGNYGTSRKVSASAHVKYVTMVDLETGEGLPLPYAESAHRSTTRSRSRSTRTVQLSGRKYPTPERSEHFAESISVACAFRDADSCDALEAMIGHNVAVKTPEDKGVTGCLSEIRARTDGGFYTVYTFTVDQMNVEEEIDIDA